HNALAFYAAGEQAGAQPQDAFELPADSPIFDPVDRFLAWNVQAPDAESRTVKAVKLYQELLRFHRNDRDPTAFLDADLYRLIFGHNKAIGEGKNERYKAALKRLAEEHPKHEVGVRALFHWGVLLRDEGDWVQARTLALRGKQALPNSHGGELCHNLVEQIESKSAVLDTERVWNDPWPTIRVRYRNLDKVHFRAVRVDFLERLKAIR